MPLLLAIDDRPDRGAFVVKHRDGAIRLRALNINRPADHPVFYLCIKALLHDVAVRLVLFKHVVH